jgi:predicted metal-dependent hydrolase
VQYGSRGRFNIVQERQFALSSSDLQVKIRRHPRARRYVLRLLEDRSARLTIPRGGTMEEAEKFLQRNLAWLERAFKRLVNQPVRPREWRVGAEILLRGEMHRLEETAGGVRLGEESIAASDVSIDLRSVIESHLWTLAMREFPAQVFHWAKIHDVNATRVTVRNQRSRWGSCSRKGAISLNWRLIQAPPVVQEYIILHELMHLRQMNHSAKYWREVEQVCPNYREAERWLRKHAWLLR